MKKIKFIVLIVIGITIVFGFYSHLIDSARVRNGIEPKFTIKIISKNGEKVTYIGLGYKIIRYVSVSPSEPYKDNKGVKYGSWFMNYNLENDKKILEIVDTSKEIKGFPCAESLEEFYKDDNYTYYFSCIKSSYVLVRYKDGSFTTVNKALKNGDISIQDLDFYNIDYIKYNNK